MLKDIDDSKRINKNYATSTDNNDGVFTSTIMSHIFWPSMGKGLGFREHVRLRKYKVGRSSSARREFMLEASARLKKKNLTLLNKISYHRTPFKRNSRRLRNPVPSLGTTTREL